MNKKEKYRILCDTESSLPLFSQAWWLDIVCDDGNWDVCLIEVENQIIAAMPYYIVPHYGFRLCVQPKLTQTLGPWIKDINLSSSKQLAYDKSILQALFQQLPKVSSFNQQWNSKYMNWLPLYWMNYHQTTKYTYRIDSLVDLDAVYSSFMPNIKREIKKADKRYNLKICEELPLSDFLVLNRKTFARQSMEQPYDDYFVETLVSEAKSRNQVKWFIAQDDLGRNHAGILIVWDDNTAYYLMGGGDPILRNSGATSLCMWEAIKFASTVTKSFDFEGSMLEPIERFFRAFGAKQTPYFMISKNNSKLLKIRRAFLEILE